jgi:hypothetical protein
MKYGKIQEAFKLSDLDSCALLISAIIHDFKHPGKTNLFLINTGHAIAVQYNGKKNFKKFLKKLKFLKKINNFPLIPS